MSRACRSRLRRSRSRRPRAGEEARRVKELDIKGPAIRTINSGRRCIQRYGPAVTVLPIGYWSPARSAERSQADIRGGGRCDMTSVEIKFWDCDEYREGARERDKQRSWEGLSCAEAVQFAVVGRDRYSSGRASSSMNTLPFESGCTQAALSVSGSRVMRPPASSMRFTAASRSATCIPTRYSPSPAG